MKFKILVVTKYKWGSRDKKHAVIRKTMMQEGNGITDVEFVTLYKDVGKPLMYKDTKGKTRISADWYEENISKNAKIMGFNAVIFQFSTKDGKAWGIAKGHRGSNLRDADFFGEAWLKCDENTVRTYKGNKKRNVYEVDMPHEIGHELKNQEFTDLDVHDFDYQREINNIEGFYQLINVTPVKELNALLNRLLDIKRNLMELFKKKNPLYEAALKFAGTDASPADNAPDELGCAESVSMVIRSVLPDFPIITGTWTLNDALSKDKRFEKVMYSFNQVIPEGTIIICATVPGKPFPAHTGIFGLNNTIFSNDSRREFLGQFLMNYTLPKWIARWVTIGGYEQHFYRLK